MLTFLLLALVKLTMHLTHPNSWARLLPGHESGNVVVSRLMPQITYVVEPRIVLLCDCLLFTVRV